MPSVRTAVWLTLLGLAVVVALPVAAQMSERQDSLPDPVPPPVPKQTPPRDVPKYESIVEDAPEEEWGLPDEMLASVQRTAAVYEEYARRFVCDEEARLAEYDDAEQVSKEKVRKYGYLLLRGSVGDPVREFRQNIGKNGQTKGEVEDSEQFPPAYMWVFLFSEFYEPYFSFRVVETRFEGFDLVHEIHFRGSLPFTDGKDIRQWEGRVLLDAFYFTLLELEAEPMGQSQRLDGLYRLWSQSFNLLGMRTGKKPLGFSAKLQFGFKKGDLRFPTSLRYDTHRAVGPEQLIMVRASTRAYTKYKFTGVTTEDPRIGDVVPPKTPPADGG